MPVTSLPSVTGCSPADSYSNGRRRRGNIRNPHERQAPVSKAVDIPPGFSPDPLTDKELETKFREMAIEYMNEQQIQKLLNTIRLDRADNAGLTKEVSI